MTAGPVAGHPLPRMGEAPEIDPDEPNPGIDPDSLATALRVLMRIREHGVVSVRKGGLAYVMPATETPGDEPFDEHVVEPDATRPTADRPVTRRGEVDPLTSRLTATLTPRDVVNLSLVVRSGRAIVGQVTIQYAYRVVSDLVADRKQWIMRTRISDHVLDEALLMLAAAHRGDVCPPADLERHARYQSAILASAVPSIPDDGTPVYPDKPFGGAYLPFCTTPGRAHVFDDDKWIPPDMDHRHRELFAVADRIIGKVFIAMRGCFFDKPYRFDVLLVRHHIDLPHLPPTESMRTLAELSSLRSQYG